MNICLFSPQEINQPLSVNDQRGKHIIKILHKTAGDTFTAGIINGHSGTATITQIKDQQIFFDFNPTGNGKELFPLKMLIGFPRPIQLKRLLRDMAGLGVCQVHLAATELGEKSYLESDLSQPENAYKMLLDGTVQAGSTHVPEIFIHKSLKSAVEFIKNSGPHKHMICLDNVNASGSLVNYFKQTQTDSTTNIVAAIGSERGWSKNERTLLEQESFIRLSMGNRILRTETASTVAASIILGSMGILD